MLKLGRLTKVKVLFLVLVFVFNFDLFKFSAAILEKGLFTVHLRQFTLRKEPPFRPFTNIVKVIFRTFYNMRKSCALMSICKTFYNMRKDCVL